LEISLVGIEVRQEHHEIFRGFEVQEHQVEVKHIEIDLLFVSKAN